MSHWNEDFEKINWLLVFERLTQYLCSHCFFFLHLRGTNHIAGSCLSIGKAGGYSKEQDKKK